MVALKSFRQHVNELLREDIVIRYHLSYDVINFEKDFTTYNDAKIYLLCVLANTPIKDLRPINSSSYILEFENEQPKLFKYLDTNLSNYFYFTISLIKEDDGNKPLIFIKTDPSFIAKQYSVWKNLTCPPEILKSMSQY